MATLSTGYSWGATEQVTNTKLNSMVNSATISGIVNADCHASMALADTKLANITTANKVCGLSIYSLNSLISGAGYLPAVNLGNFASLVSLSGLVPRWNLCGSLASGALPQYDGTKNFVGINPLALAFKKGANIASAATLTLGTDGNIFTITGNTTISNINSMPAGMYVLIMASNPVIQDGNNLKLGSDFSTNFDDTLTLISDGSLFYEIGRSSN